MPSLAAITPGASSNPVPNPPLRSPRSEHNRNSTPSISPLSTTSRAHNEYFASTDHARQSPIQEPTVIQTPLSTGDIHVPDVEMRDHDDNDDDDDDDDRSSSLSDFEAEFEDKENNNTHDDKDARPEDADSEAETERLERTPQKLPKSTTETGRTPSKLNQETSMGADLSDAMSSPRSPLRDPQSPSPTQRFKRAPSYSSTPAAAARLTRKPSASPSALGTQHAGDKRKRFTPTSSGDSPLTSDAESDSEELDATNHTNGKASTQHKATGDVAHDRVDAPNDELGMPESARETPEPDEIDENPYISPMKAARLKGKKERAKRQKETPVVQKSDYEAEYDETMEIDELADDDESAAKSEEDRESKKQAHAEYLALAEKFHIFRTKYVPTLLSSPRRAMLTLVVQAPSRKAGGGRGGARTTDAPSTRPCHLSGSAASNHAALRDQDSPGARAAILQDASACQSDPRRACPATHSVLSRVTRKQGQAPRIPRQDVVRDPERAQEPAPARRSRTLCIQVRYKVLGSDSEPGQLQSRGVDTLGHAEIRRLSCRARDQRHKDKRA